jgi:hypothetical protein
MLQPINRTERNNEHQKIPSLVLSTSGSKGLISAKHQAPLFFGCKDTTFI